MDSEQPDNRKTKKRIKPTERELTSALFELRLKELNISAQDADEYTMGFVFDILTEKHNDTEKYDKLATQEDIDKLLG